MENLKKFAPGLPKKRGKQTNGKVAARKMKVTQPGNFTFIRGALECKNDIRQQR